ncbi:GAF and ANTAR domain-containing protein [Pseudonocardia sp. N23]|uniref:GAF and ANTAR domain-containing protein n=1 Tax=Pseudonocardia sp. N23 TaxID=1987376 RepID=UPI000BFEA2D9|nr:GAF and ANTAR domain-containing protein [Pseudonocardia sp. N23]GAY10980.1 hypothetical protein TOK_5465 [Pseudonocardia sp. N23]
MAERAPDLDTRFPSRPGAFAEDPTFAYAPANLVTGSDTALDLAVAMGELAHHLHSAADADQVVGRVLDACISLVDGCTHDGITARTPRGQVAPRARCPLARALDTLQYDLDEGPGPQAIRESRTIHAAELATDPRWPRFGPRAADLGALSVLTCRLFTGDRATAAINLYGTAPHAFTTNDEIAAAVIAAHASVAIDSVRTRTQLAEAIRTRQLIGEAVGILKERHQVSSQQAFNRLRAASQDLNVKLRVIAEHLTTDATQLR